MTDKSRLLQAQKIDLKPDSLVGSFFHGTIDQQWQGLIVAEPAPSIYLVELLSWVHGHSTTQRLVRIEDMLDWQFYDDADWMNEAYEHGVSQRWEYENTQREKRNTDD